MKRGYLILVSMLVILSVPALLAARGDGEEVRKEFDDIKSIRINTVSGDVVVIAHGSDEVIVELEYDVEPMKNFEYKMRDNRGRLVLEEEWRGRGGSGHVIWTLYVPEGMEIDFSTASGDFTAEGVGGEIDVSTASGDIDITDSDAEIDASTASGDVRLINVTGDYDISTASGDIYIEGGNEGAELSTASGDIEAVNIKGEIRLSTASGDVEVEDCEGTFRLSTASGTVKADGIKIEGHSKFSTASGSVRVILAETSEYDLDLSTASGDVSLDYDGNEVVGYFEFEAHERRGRIKCPFDFDGEEEYEHYGQDYVRKWFSRKGDDPQIILSTASGTVILKK